MGAPAITPLIMPKWGLEMREGTIAGWLVDEGTRITVGTPVLDVETDKINNAVEAPDAGLLRRKVAKDGEVLPVKALLAVLAEPEVSDADIDAFIAAYEVPSAGEDDADEDAAFQWAEVAGIRVRYARRGREQGVPVLFVHGFGGDLCNWLFNLDAAAEHAPVIALDLPGHGQSDAKLPGTSLPALADFVARLLHQRAVERRQSVDQRAPEQELDRQVADPLHARLRDSLLRGQPARGEFLADRERQRVVDVALRGGVRVLAERTGQPVEQHDAQRAGREAGAVHERCVEHGAIRPDVQRVRARRVCVRRRCASSGRHVAASVRAGHAGRRRSA